MAVMLLVATGLLQTTAINAQKFTDVEKVGYIQLPGVSADYTTVSVYLLQEKNSAEKKLGGMIGGLAKKVGNDDVAQGIEEFAKNAIGGQEEKHAEWTLLPGDFPNTGSKHLKIVIAYAPDEGFRPMGAPMKNNDGEFQFGFNTKAKMMVYSDANKLILEKDFGYLTGVGTSEDWPSGGGGGSAAFGISMDKKKKDKKDAGGGSSDHPYTIACSEGAVEHAKRVIFGMYGVQKFEKVPMHIAFKGKPENLKNLAKNYTKLIEDKEDLVLNSSEKAQMQQIVEEWESAITSDKPKNAWMYSYNLAAGYSWLLNPEKSKEHIAKVYDAQKKLFDKIINKTGSWGNSDIELLSAYNSLQPFAEYYAEGLTKYPDYVWNKGELFAPAFLAARNVMVSQAMGFEMPIPFFPVDRKAKLKNGSVNVKVSGKKIAESSFNYDDNKLSDMKVEGKAISGGKLDSKFSVPDNSDNHPSERNRYFDETEDNGNKLNLTTRFGAKGYNYNGEWNIGVPFPLFVADGIKGDYGFQEGRMDIVVNDQGLFEQYDMKTSSEWGFTATMKQKDKWTLTVSPDDFVETFKVLEKDPNGNPVKIEHSYLIENTFLSVHAEIKYKFGEETSKESQRQRSADSEAYTVAEQMLLDAVKANGGTVEDGAKEGEYTFKYSKVYDTKVEVDKKGLWKKMTIGDYEITRKLK